MEVPGRKLNPSQEVASSDDISQECQQCLDGGGHVPAIKYCEQCQEFLCRSCCHFHEKVKTARNHDLLEISDVKNLTSRLILPTIKCSVHTDKIIDFFCPSHNVAVCSACGLLNHKPCHVQYIPELSKKYEKSQEYENLQNDLHALFKETSLFVSTVEVGKEEVDADANSIVERIRKLRKDINVYLEEKEKEMTEKVETMRCEDIKKLQNANEECNKIRIDVADMQKRLTLYCRNESDLLITSKQSISRLNDIQCMFKASKANFQAFVYSFTESRLCQDLLLSGGLGGVERLVKDVSFEENRQTENQTIATLSLSSKHFSILKAEVSKLSDIIVKTATDKKSCWLTGIIFLPPKTLLLADSANNCVKLVDNKTNTVTTSLLLSSEPWDISKLGTNDAVVTLPTSRKVEVISTKRGLFLTQTISVSGECRGIDSTANRIIVSFTEPVKVDVLDYSGRILHTITNDKTGKPIYTCPFYLRVIIENGQPEVYVSDYNRSTITKMPIIGPVAFAYEHKDLSQPRKIDATDDGHLLVCGYLSHTVQVVSQNGKYVRTLLSRDAIESPLSMCYSEEQRLVYVSCASQRNKIRVFKLQ